MASNLRSVMTWKQAVEQFKEHVLPSVVATEKLYGRGPDLPMRRETWNNWIDSLCKNEQISDWQYNNWSQPECCEGQYMQVGDLVKVLIADGKPTGIITHADYSTRWTALYKVLMGGDWPRNTYVDFREHQLEVISASR